MERRWREGRTIRLDDDEKTQPIPPEPVSFADEDRRREPRTRVDEWPQRPGSRRVRPGR